jgi:hypothetical protein
MYNCRGCTS